MQILGHLGLCFDAAVVFFKNFSLIFRLALTILWPLVVSLLGFHFTQSFKQQRCEMESFFHECKIVKVILYSRSRDKL